MHPIGTVPTDKMHPVGTVLTDKMHPVGTAPNAPNKDFAIQSRVEKWYLMLSLAAEEVPKV